MSFKELFPPYLISKAPATIMLSKFFSFSFKNLQYIDGNINASSHSYYMPY